MSAVVWLVIHSSRIENVIQSTQNCWPTLCSICSQRNTVQQHERYSCNGPAVCARVTCCAIHWTICRSIRSLRTWQALNRAIPTAVWTCTQKPTTKRLNNNLIAYLSFGQWHRFSDLTRVAPDMIFSNPAGAWAECFFWVVGLCDINSNETQE